MTLKYIRCNYQKVPENIKHTKFNCAWEISRKKAGTTAATRQHQSYYGWKYIRQPINNHLYCAKLEWAQNDSVEFHNNKYKLNRYMQFGQMLLITRREIPLHSHIFMLDVITSANYPVLKCACSVNFATVDKTLRIKVCH